MKVIAVANTKGGVAKTTTCLSLGGSLAEQGNLVLLVDLDPQAHLTSSLGVKPDDLRRTVSDVLLNQDSLTSISLETQVFGLDLAPANDELVIIDKMLYKHPGYEYRLKTDIEDARRVTALSEAASGPGTDLATAALYDVVIMDCPPTFGTVTINALTAADLLIIPLQCEHYAVQSLIRMLDMVRLTRRKTNPGIRYRLLVTMFDMRNKVHPRILKYLRQHFSEALFESFIQVDTKLRESPAHAKPITQYAPQTRAARQYRALACELMDYLGLEQEGHGVTASSLKPKAGERKRDTKGAEEKHDGRETGTRKARRPQISMSPPGMGKRPGGGRLPCRRDDGAPGDDGAPAGRPGGGRPGGGRGEATLVGDDGR